MLCFVPVLRGCEWYVCSYVRKKALLHCLIAERRDMGIYEVPLSMSLLGFGMGTWLANFDMCGIMLVLRAVFNMLVRNASPRGVVVSVMLYPCILCVALSIDLFVLCVACLTVFMNCLVKQFAMCLGVVAILLLNVMEVFRVGGSALLDRICMVFQRMCVLCLWSQCASKCSFHRFCLCFCMSEVISSYNSLRAGSHVFALLMLSLCVFCIICGRIRVCSCSASCPLVCCVYLPSV